MSFVRDLKVASTRDNSNIYTYNGSSSYNGNTTTNKVY